MSLQETAIEAAEAIVDAAFDQPDIEIRHINGHISRVGSRAGTDGTETIYLPDVDTVQEQYTESEVIPYYRLASLYNAGVIYSLLNHHREKVYANADMLLTGVSHEYDSDKQFLSGLCSGIVFPISETAAQSHLINNYPSLETPFARLAQTNLHQEAINYEGLPDRDERKATQCLLRYGYSPALSESFASESLYALSSYREITEGIYTSDSPLDEQDNIIFKIIKHYLGTLYDADISYPELSTSPTQVDTLLKKWVPDQHLLHQGWYDVDGSIDTEYELGDEATILREGRQ